MLRMRHDTHNRKPAIRIMSLGVVYMRRLVRAVVLIVFIAHMPATLGVVAQEEADPCDTIFDHDFAQVLLDTSSDGSAVDAYDPDGNGIACDHKGPPDTDGQSVLTTQDGNSMVVAAESNQPQVPTDQEEAYIDAIMSDADDYASIMQQIGPLFQQAGANPAVVFNETWQIQLAAQLVQWETVSERAHTYQPSERQHHIHAIWLTISELSLKAIDDIIQGVDTIDADALNRGTARLNYMSLLVEDVMAAVTQFLTDPNAPFTSTHAINPVPGCEVFPSYEEAQHYYAAFPEEQPTIDPDWDGLACEVYFGR